MGAKSKAAHVFSTANARVARDAELLRSHQTK